MTLPLLDGVFSIKIAVSDLERSRTWYESTLGLVVDIEFPDDDGVVRGVAGHVAGVAEVYVALRTDRRLAAALDGSNLFNFGVADDHELEHWVARLDQLQVPHSPMIDATIGWMVVVNDPDGYEIHLYSREPHGLDQHTRSGYGRPTAPVETTVRTSQ